MSSERFGWTRDLARMRARMSTGFMELQLPTSLMVKCNSASANARVTMAAIALGSIMCYALGSLMNPSGVEAVFDFASFVVYVALSQKHVSKRPIQATNATKNDVQRVSGYGSVPAQCPWYPFQKLYFPSCTYSRQEQRVCVFLKSLTGSSTHHQHAPS
eukprot:4909380-Amphidinium_carterae.2